MGVPVGDADTPRPPRKSSRPVRVGPQLAQVDAGPLERAAELVGGSPACSVPSIVFGPPSMTSAVACVPGDLRVAQRRPVASAASGMSSAICHWYHAALRLATCTVQRMSAESGGELAHHLAGGVVAVDAEAAPCRLSAPEASR